jgi:hypothetical protein
MATINVVAGRGVFIAACALAGMVLFNEAAFSQTTLPKRPGIRLSGEA